MKDINLIIATGISNNIRMKTVTITFIGVTLICAVGLAVAICLLLIEPAMKAPVPDRSALELYLNIIMYSACQFGLGVCLNAFGFQSMTREKSRGVMASLLATPLKVRDIWIGKSLAVYLPGLVLGEIMTLIAMIAVNIIYFVPRTGFLITPWIAISSFVAAPLIYLSLSLLVHLIGLTGRPATGNVIVQVFLPVFVSLMVNLMVHDILDSSSWVFTMVNIGVALIIGVIIFLLRSRLTVEKIVLSC